MLRGYYLATQGILNQQRRLDAVTNNIANINTAGYKRDLVLTNTFDRQMILVNKRKELSGTFEQAYVDLSKTTLEQGMLEYTENPFDVAPVGSVFYNIEAYNGEVMLTRNGQWNLDEEGYLALGRSGRILGENGPIQLGTKDFRVDNEGYIYTDDGLVDRLQLTFIEETADVTAFGENMFIPAEGTIQEGPPEGERWSIIQGAYEKSNVNLAYETTLAMEVQRLFEACSQALKMIDTINAKSVDIARIN